MFVAPITIATLAEQRLSIEPGHQPGGFSRQTTMTVTRSNYLTPGPATLSDPLPAAPF
jgi:hypothetical protein